MITLALSMLAENGGIIKVSCKGQDSFPEAVLPKYSRIHFFKLASLPQVVISRKTATGSKVGAKGFIS